MTADISEFPEIQKTYRVDSTTAIRMKVNAALGGSRGNPEILFYVFAFRKHTYTLYHFRAGKCISAEREHVQTLALITWK